MTRTAALHGDDWSLVLEMVEGGVPLWRHLGARIGDKGVPRESAIASRATFALNTPAGLTALPQGGLGWFGPSMLSVTDLEGNGIVPHFSESVVEATTHRSPLPELTG